ncbi:hypothetical protein IEN85_07720 [Pelagicoccus sp. NFK12]|uniref:Lipoprotein n=1 Tax=Pelagicoccus enzymogenes TaxID=2773457 RepID=A0A927F6P3_9BACT|nr:hypothetical protein [Pelagicoccus enzymogenes]MBD5779379.1 hypothetical protein [Pelagicoccus enzymogenes]
MKQEHAGAKLLFFVAALALSACSDQRQEPSPKAAEIEEVTNVDDAKSHFLKGIDWSERSGARATLYYDLLKRNDSLGERSSSAMYHPSEYEWFAFIDYEPGAYFKHPTAFAVLTYEEPKIKVYRRSHLPLLNEESIWSSASELLRDENVFYDKSWTQRTPFRDTESILAHKAEHWPPRMSSDRCPNEQRAYAVLIHNLTDLSRSPESIDNLDAMAAALTANGYYVQEFIHDPATGEKRAYLDLAAPKGAGIYQLINFINIHQDFNDCCEEVLVYITGETSLEKSDYREEVSFDIPFAYAGREQNRKPALKFYPEDFAVIFDELKTCHLNFIVDTNNAEGFAADLLRIPNTESVLTACALNEYTYSSAVETLGGGSFEDAFGIAQGEKGSEFTSSVVKALFENAAERKDGDPPEAAAILVKSAFESVKLFDLSYHGGKTNPKLQGRTLNSRCPCGIDHQLTRY